MSRSRGDERAPSKEDLSAAARAYRDDPKLADLHPHRVKGTSGYVWHLFDRLDDLRPILKG